MAYNPGDLFAGYTILRLIGAGGMGEVYLARHPALPRREALKVIPTSVSADPTFRQRFTREAELASSVVHPSIVTIYNSGEFDGRLWLSMEYIDGTDAAELLRESPTGLEPESAASVASAVGGALDAAHVHGLLHRDVKPANILVQRFSGSAPARVVLADFGIAKSRDETTNLTSTNMFVGTAAYVAPEQMLDGTIDGRADQYALAATIFELLTGRPPFTGDSTAQIIAQHLHAPRPQVTTVRPELPAAADAVLMRGLAVDPTHRFGTCAEFASALRKALIAPPTVQVLAARPPMPPYVAGPPSTPPPGQRPPTPSQGQRPSGPTPAPVPRPTNPPPQPGPRPVVGTSSYTGGHPPPPPSQRPPHGAGYPGGPTPKKSSNTPAILAGAACFVVLLLVAGVILITMGGNDSSTQADQSASVTTTETTTDTETTETSTSTTPSTTTTTTTNDTRPGPVTSFDDVSIGDCMQFGDVDSEGRIDVNRQRCDDSAVTFYAVEFVGANVDCETEQNPRLSFDDENQVLCMTPNLLEGQCYQLPTYGGSLADYVAARCGGRAAPRTEIAEVTTRSSGRPSCGIGETEWFFTQPERIGYCLAQA